MQCHLYKGPNNVKVDKITSKKMYVNVTQYRHITSAFFNLCIIYIKVRELLIFVLCGSDVY